jgi:hypothetical protein
MFSCKDGNSVVPRDEVSDLDRAIAVYQVTLRSKAARLF